VKITVLDSLSRLDVSSSSPEAVVDSPKTGVQAAMTKISKIFTKRLIWFFISSSSKLENVSVQSVTYLN
jgi:hypothetical protein